MREVIIPNGSRAVEADYKEQVIPDYRGNPFIEALPNLFSTQEIIEKLASYPTYNKEERLLDSHYRMHMIDRLFQVFQPLPMVMRLEKNISQAIRWGYISRNAFGNKLAQGFHTDYHSPNSISVEKEGEFFSSTLGFSLIGISGIGKTSSLQRILRLYPQIIVHSEYKGEPFSTYQVVYLKLECPFDGSIKGLLYEFFAEIDRLLGTNYYEKVMRAKASTDAMLTMANQIVRNCNLGLLVIDEIQHLSTAKSGGSQKMLNFFVNLVNNVGVPVILVGTPAAIKVFQEEFRQARRCSGSGGDMVCDRLQKDEVWKLFLNSIWRYQWTKKVTILTMELSDVLYEETQGIPDLVKKLYATAQEHAISMGKEEVTAEIIKKVAKENFKLVQPMITALKTNNLRAIAKFEDINLFGVDFVDALTRTKESMKLDLKIRSEKENLVERKETVKVAADDVIDEIGAKEPNKQESKVEERISEKIIQNNKDIRIFIEKGEKNNKSNYYTLKEAGYIIGFESDIFSREVVQ